MSYCKTAELITESKLIFIRLGDGCLLSVFFFRFMAAQRIQTRQYAKGMSVRLPICPSVWPSSCLSHS